jgi:hypothetical protein
MNAAALILLALGLQAEPPCVEAIARLTSRDREAQAVAVRDLSATSACESALVDTWKSTKRFDVRAGIAEILLARGDAGLARFIELVRGDRTEIGGEFTLLARALAARGMDAIPIIERDGRLVGMARRIVGVMGASPEAGAREKAVAFGEALLRRLLASSNPSVRSTAMEHLELLPVAERLDAIVRASQSSDASERSAALARLSLARFAAWMASEAEAGPVAFGRYVEAVCELAASDQADVAGPACAALGAIGTAPIAHERRLALLRRAVRDPRWRANPRELAMRGLLLADPDVHRAVMEVVAVAKTEPRVVGEVLESLRAEDIPDEAIEPLVAVLSRADGYNGNQLWSVLVRLKVRAVPALVGALGSTINGPTAPKETTQTRDLCSALGAIGTDAIVALPTLLTVARPESNDRYAGTALAAALCIAPRDEEVGRLLHQAVRRASTDPAAAMVAWEAINVVLNRSRKRPELLDAIGIEAIARTILVERIEPLCPVFRAHPVVAHALMKERTALEAALREPRWRGPLLWAMRETAEPPPWLIDVLIALAKEAQSRVPDPANGASPDELLPMPLAVTLARICDLDPVARERVCLALHSFPQALCEIATARYETGPHRLPVMPSMPASVVDVLEAELEPRLERLESGQRNAILAYARLPNATKERSARLLDIVRYGEGANGPVAALEGLGSLRPFVESNLAVMREHLHHPHYEMVAAAMKGAELSGPHAVSLVKDLVALGSAAPGYATETDAYTAVKAIAPDTTDPEVVAFMKAFEDRRRTSRRRN